LLSSLGTLYSTISNEESISAANFTAPGWQTFHDCYANTVQGTSYRGDNLISSQPNSCEIPIFRRSILSISVHNATLLVVRDTNQTKLYAKWHSYAEILSDWVLIFQFDDGNTIYGDPSGVLDANDNIQLFFVDSITYVGFEMVQ
jgi:hypothetical protein